MQDELDISKVDFNDIEDILGFGTLILSCAGRSGLFDSVPSRQSKDEIYITETAKRWVRGVKSKLPEMSAADAFRLTDIYDLVHRIAYRKPVESALMDKLILDAFDSLIHGDRSVDRYRLYDAINTQILRRNGAFFDRPLQWICINLDRWRKNFLTGGWHKLPDYDVIRQSGILIGADPFAFEDRIDGFKQSVFESSRHYLDETQDMSSIELEGLSQFLKASVPFIRPEEYMEYDEAITNAIISGNGSNSYYRKSLEMSLTAMRG